MAITATTTSAAVGASDTTVSVASATGITAPNFQTAAGITYLRLDNEVMLVVGVVGTVVSVLRAQDGTVATTHVSGALVQIGLPSDFATRTQVFDNIAVNTLVVTGRKLPAIWLSGSADAIPAGVSGYYVIKTAGVDAMTLAAPTLAQEGNVIDIWSDTTNAHTLTATSLLANGTALKTTATFPAFRGAGLTLVARNLVYHVVSNGASAGVVVLT